MTETILTIRGASTTALEKSMAGTVRVAQQLKRILELNNVAMGILL